MKHFINPKYFYNKVCILVEWLIVVDVDIDEWANFMMYINFV